jgi:hypothetical protein
MAPMLFRLKKDCGGFFLVCPAFRTVRAAQTDIMVQ